MICLFICFVWFPDVGLIRISMSSASIARPKGKPMAESSPRNNRQSTRKRTKTVPHNVPQKNFQHLSPSYMKDHPGTLPARGPSKKKLKRSRGNQQVKRAQDTLQKSKGLSDQQSLKTGRPTPGKPTSPPSVAEPTAAGESPAVKKNKTQQSMPAPPAKSPKKKRKSQSTETPQATGNQPPAQTEEEKQKEKQIQRKRKKEQKAAKKKAEKEAAEKRLEDKQLLAAKAVRFLVDFEGSDASGEFTTPPPPPPKRDSDQPSSCIACP